MKRLLPIFLAACAVVACTGGSKTNQNTDSSSEYTSPDRQMLGIRGNVLAVYQEYINTDSLGTPDSDEEGDDFILRDTILFDSEGKILKGEFSYYTADTYNVTRDSEGRIIRLASDTAKTDFEENFEFKYKNGVLASHTSEMFGELYFSSETKYTYDDKGFILTIHDEGNSDELQFTDLITRKYLEYDEQGNWTKAFVIDEHKEIDGDETYSYTQYKTITRKYQYE